MSVRNARRMRSPDVGGAARRAAPFRAVKPDHPAAAYESVAQASCGVQWYPAFSSVVLADPGWGGSGSLRAMPVRPIFIFSISRSGSTLLQRVLAAHPEVATVSEPWLLLPFVYSMRTEGVIADYVHPLL